MRFKSVKHAEYEILKAIMVTRAEGTFPEEHPEYGMDIREVKSNMGSD